MVYKGTNIIMICKGKKVKCFGNASFIKLGATEELHLLRLLTSHGLSTIIHQIRHQIRPRSWCPPQGRYNAASVISRCHKILNWTLG